MNEGFRSPSDITGARRIFKKKSLCWRTRSSTVSCRRTPGWLQLEQSRAWFSAALQAAHPGGILCPGAAMAWALGESSSLPAALCCQLPSSLLLDGQSPSDLWALSEPGDPFVLPQVLYLVRGTSQTVSRHGDSSSSTLASVTSLHSPGSQL